MVAWVLEYIQCLYLMSLTACVLCKQEFARFLTSVNRMLLGSHRHDSTAHRDHTCRILQQLSLRSFDSLHEA
jgi:hypothetical protein